MFWKPKLYSIEFNATELPKKKKGGGRGALLDLGVGKLIVNLVRGFLGLMGKAGRLYLVVINMIEKLGVDACSKRFWLKVLKGREKIK